MIFNEERTEFANWLTSNLVVCLFIQQIRYFHPGPDPSLLRALLPLMSLVSTKLLSTRAFQLVLLLVLLLSFPLVFSPLLSFAFVGNRKGHYIIENAFPVSNTAGAMPMM